MKTEVRLSIKQKEAVNHENGPLLVVAGPGSGKTRVLTERIRRLLGKEPSNFSILALTFTNKSANEMKERLEDIAEIQKRAFIGTLHSFCMETLIQRGKFVGIIGNPQIIQSYQDLRELVIQAAMDDSEIGKELINAGDQEKQAQRIDAWLSRILYLKGLLLTEDEVEEPFDRRLLSVYNAGLRMSAAVDFADILLLTYRLFEERPKIAAFYRKLYRYICIDEAQDLNRAQYGVICALCGSEFDNVMMVGDPKQSIYGFNMSSPRYMDDFKEKFGAKIIELDENFRSSKAVVVAANELDQSYRVSGKLPIKGEIKLVVGLDEQQEAMKIIDALEDLIENGHEDIEGYVTLERCAILARTRYALLAVEEVVRDRGWSYYKKLSANYQSESDLVRDFELSLRLVVNPNNRLHLDQLRKRWKTPESYKFTCKGTGYFGSEGYELVKRLCDVSDSEHCPVVANAVESLGKERGKLQFLKSLNILEDYATSLTDEEIKRSIWEDVTVLKGEWNRYLRAEIGDCCDLGAFLTHVALGTTQQPRENGLALLTVHSSKGLEFDVVCVMGMSEGTFPDYRAIKDSSNMAEEKRNAFVAITRSKRILFLSYPQTKKMPWGGIWQQKPSRFLKTLGLVY